MNIPDAPTSEDLDARLVQQISDAETRVTTAGDEAIKADASAEAGRKAVQKAQTDVDEIVTNADNGDAVDGISLAGLRDNLEPSQTGAGRPRHGERQCRYRVAGGER